MSFDETLIKANVVLHQTDMISVIKVLYLYRASVPGGDPCSPSESEDSEEDDDSDLFTNPNRPPPAQIESSPEIEN